MSYLARKLARGRITRARSDAHLDVLLVEDETRYARLVERALAGGRSDTVTLAQAACLKDGIACLEGRHFDAVLLDLGLPDSSGLRTLRSVQRHAPRVPVVVLTGAADEELALEALTHGAQDYLVKTEADGDRIVRALRYAVERQRLLDAIAELSLVDELTGLYNRRGFLTLAERQLAVGRRRDDAMVLMLADVDGLKQINDTHGHLAGDRVLAFVGASLRAVCRETDVVARVGGDEFSVLLTDAAVPAAQRVVSRLRERLARGVLWRGARLTVGVSAGLAECERGGPRRLEPLFARADAQMYGQKRAGRPRRVIAAGR